MWLLIDFGGNKGKVVGNSGVNKGVREKEELLLPSRLSVPTAVPAIQNIPPALALIYPASVAG